jgi:NIMA-interacting peptidyl-prolyl cis-trans isomerase 1
LESSDGTKVRLDRPFATFGRAAELCDVAVDSEGVSRLHAAFVHHGENGKLYAIDLSTGGTWVDSLRLIKNKPLSLKPGYRLRFGSEDAAPWTVFIEHAAAAGSKRAAAAEAGDAKRSRSEESVRASHLLVKHAGSRRPSSWKEATITRSPEEALAAVQDFHARLTANGDSCFQNETLAAEFAALARTESHCSSASRGGDLGAFGRGKMTPSFEAAAFALDVGRLSGPVSSDSGWHLILRTG